MPLGSRVAPRNGQPLLDAQHGFRIRAEGEGALAAYEENLPDDGSRHIKARLSALGDRGKELGLDTLGGFLSGLFLSGAKGGYNAAEFSRMGQEALDTGSYRASPACSAYRAYREKRRSVQGVVTLCAVMLSFSAMPRSRRAAYRTWRYWGSFSPRWVRSNQPFP